MARNKIILNLCAKMFVELAVFQANTTMFQVNTNASLKNLETQVGQLALNMQNQSRDSFPTNVKKNPKVYMAITLRSGKELQERKEVKKKQIDNEAKIKYQNSTSNNKGQSKNGLSNENQQLKEQREFATKKTV